MSSRRKPLTEKELADIADNWAFSDDEVEDFSDTDSLVDPAYIPHSEDDSSDIESDDHDNITLSQVEQTTIAHDIGHETREEDEAESENPVNEVSEVVSKGSNKIIWKKKHLVVDSDSSLFRGKTDLPQEISDLETPYNYFKYFFTDELLTHIRDQTDLFSTQKNPNKPVTVSTQDLEKFLGICLYMSVSKLPRTRCYWRHGIGIQNIREVMPMNEFEAIKSNSNFNENETMLAHTHENIDSLHKLRPVVDHLCKRFASIPLGPKLAVDEQICATKVRHPLKTYNPLKPHKWGYKLYVLCGTDGYAYNFEIYQGSSNFITKPKPNEPDLGSSSNAVVRLARVVPRNQNYQLYCDNYYTSIPLFVHLAEQGIHMLGTVRTNRIPNKKLTDGKIFKKMPRGTCEEYVANVNNIDVSVISWNDTKVVNMLSTCHGKLPSTKVRRYDKKRKGYIEIDRPKVISEYNQHMGGVDLLDSYIGRYKIPIRSKKWYLLIFFHSVDVAVINAFLLNKKALHQKGEISSEILNLWQFRLEVAECLCLMGTNSSRKRGRPSTTLEAALCAKCHKGPAVHIPPKNVRLDESSHWIKYDTNRQRCKLPQCEGYKHFKCEKSGAHLCLTKDKNCFRSFHE